MAAVNAGIRLDEALRGFLAEQGAKRVTKDDLWSLVMATTRLRLTAYSLASLCGSGVRAGPAGPPAHPGPDGEVRDSLREEAAELAHFYDDVATAVGPPGQRARAPLAAPTLDGPGWQHSLADTGPATQRDPHVLWVADHLHHLGSHADAITGPALRVAEERRLPWWR
jgi:hypothetical protein